MKSGLENYARIGLVHHLLYSESLAQTENHVRTLEAFIQRDDIETLDCCLPLEGNCWQGLAEKIKACGKEHITFATHMLPLRTRSLATTDAEEQRLNQQAVTLMVQQAAAMGATGFIFPSGGPSPEQAQSGHYTAFVEFCRWLCEQLKPYGITAMLEPFDTAIDKKFLYGPSALCAALAAKLKAEGFDFGIELDMAHVPLMGETFEQAVKNTAPHLKRVHLGNCVLRDKNHPRYGDTHPAPGIDGGEVGVEQMKDFLRLLLEVGYLNQERRGDLVMEIMPDKGADKEQTVQDSMRLLRQAWQGA